MLSDYINAAMRHAEYEVLEDNEGWFGHIPQLPGVWASERNVEETRNELRGVLEDRILYRLVKGLTVPAVDGIDLMSLTPSRVA